MNEKVNEENIEEVPLDLFNQVSLEDEDLEIVDLSESKSTSTNLGANAISIPADAYFAVLQAEKNNSQNSQQTN